MKRPTSWILLVLLVPVLTGCQTAADADANVSPSAGDAVRRPVAQLVGTWHFVRQEGRNIQSGEAVANLASEGLPGILIYAPDGWMSVSIDRRPTGGSFWGYFGTFSIENGRLVHTIEGGTVSARGPSPAEYRLEEGGRRLVISTLPNANNVVVHYTFARAE